MSSDIKRKLRWVRPQPLPGDGAADIVIPVERDDFSRALSDIIADIGLPTVGGSTPLEEAVGLLQVASEIEHALMVQYLYALYSIPSQASTNTARRDLRTISVQEMGHLITLQNILLMLGESTYLSRQDVSPQPDWDPIPFRLEPLLKTSLAKYVAAESPLLKSGDDGFEQLEEILAEAEVATASDVHRVGLIYAMLYWLFQPSDTPHPPMNLSTADGFPAGFHLAEPDLGNGPASLNRQADSNEWSGSVLDVFVDLAANRDEVLTAVHKISFQGEGLTNDGGDQSHFVKFRRLYEGFDGFPAPISIPVNPTLGIDPITDPQGEENRITNPAAVLWGRLFDVRYEMLLVCIAHSFLFDRSLPEQANLRSVIIGWAMEEMRDSIRPIATVLIKLPRKADLSPNLLAGPPFSLDAGNFPAADPELWKLQKELIDASAAIINEILTTSNPDVIQTGRLQTLIGNDQNRSPIVDERLTNG